MTDVMRRPVSQVRAGDLVAVDDGGVVYVVRAISLPVGTSRRAALVDAHTGEPARSVRLPLHGAVATYPGAARWVVVTNESDGSVQSVLAGPQFHASGEDSLRHEVWDVEIDLMGRPGWEQLRRGARQLPRASAA